MTTISESNPGIFNKITKIESIYQRDVGNKIEPLFSITRGSLLNAAQSITEHSSPHVANITGFFMPDGIFHFTLFQQTLIS